jgi:hypothetical protein
MQVQLAKQTQEVEPSTPDQYVQLRKHLQDLALAREGQLARAAPPFPSFPSFPPFPLFPPFMQFRMWAPFIELDRSPPIDPPKRAKSG